VFCLNWFDFFSFEDAADVKVSFFHKIIYSLGEKIRNPLIKETYLKLLASDFWTIEELEELQLKKLQKLLKYSKKNSLYYSNLLDVLDIDTVTLKNFVHVPVLSKNDIYKNGSQIQNNPENAKLIKSETSGSTGNALIFYRNMEWDAAARAAQLRGYSWYGVSPWEKNVYFWGFNPEWRQLVKIRFMDFLVNRFRIFSFDERVLQKVGRIINNCSYVEGYSSAIYTMSVFFKNNGESFNNLKMIKGTSEKIYDYYQEAVRSVFGKKMISEYGSAETGIIAFECPSGNMHIAMENVIVEEIDNKIVVTNLNSFSFPVIRYELGDYIELDKTTRCPCGRQHYIVKEVTGRVGRKIYGFESVYPTLTLYYIFKNIALTKGVQLAYFGKQAEKGYLVIEIIKPQFDGEQIIDYITIESEKYFGSDMQITIEFIDGINTKDKKVKDFESSIGCAE